MDIRMGTTGWAYDDWVGPFYPEGTPQNDFLAVYSQHYDLVEVDSTFYRPPTAETIDRWRRVTPRGFRFALKVSREITHDRVLLGCRDEYRAFTETVKGLGNKLLCVLFQFGYFNKQAFPNHNEFFERLDQFLSAAADPSVPVAVEIRNKTWLRPEWFDLLRRHRAASVLVDHPWMPTIPEVAKRFDICTGPLAYVRLLGDREEIERITTRWDKTVIDKTARLEEIAETIGTLSNKIPVVVLANNHYSGHAPTTLTDLASVIGRLSPITQ
jgi:uncharacterized protein YecE (DUF72 family)